MSPAAQPANSQNRRRRIRPRPPAGRSRRSPAGQRVLRALHADVTGGLERIARMTAEEFGATGPGLEIAQMRHARQRARTSRAIRI